MAKKRKKNPRKSKILETLATKWVGAGSKLRPNLYFVGGEDGIQAIFLDEDDAIEYADRNGLMVEDESGVFYESDAYLRSLPPDNE